MRNLFVSYYKQSDPERQKEIDTCFIRNVENPHIDRIIVASYYHLPISSEKIISKFSHGDSKPRYNTFFEVVNSYTGESDINIIANSDIIFDETIKLADKMGENDCYALSRWELKPDYTKHLTQIQVFGDSQDSWIFRGKIKPLEFCDFPIGTRGCDNRIAYEIQKAGYRITNPSKSIHTWHLHNSGVRDYLPGQGYAVPEPYLNVPVCML